MNRAAHTDEKWWGWGDPKKGDDLSRHPEFIKYLRKHIDFSGDINLPPPDITSIIIPETRFTNNDIEFLNSIVSSESVHTSERSRIINSYGKSYRDLLRIRKKQIENVPDAVVFPKSEEEIQSIMSWAGENSIALVPRGGGTSVVGGVEAVCSVNNRAVIVLNLRFLNKVLHINTTSLVADVEAGTFGPDLEDALNRKGFTLGHFPESFEYSTLGGWIAARSAGQQSTLYGKIEEMVESLRVVTPDGIIQTVNVPASADGPELKRMLIGSEGVYGIITRARIKLRPVPEEKYYTAYLVQSFEEGSDICRRIIQSGITPAAIRLSDEDETEFAFSLLTTKWPGLKNLLLKAGRRWIERKGYIPGKRSFLLLGFEGKKNDVAHERKKLRSVLSESKVLHLGRTAGNRWYKQRFENPYRRDALLDHGIMVDTLETAVEWDLVKPLYYAVMKKVRGAYDELGIKGIVMGHLSHMYSTGSSLYFILIASPHQEKELEQWQVIKRAASTAIIEFGGAISHHHGVGLDHKQWLEPAIGRESISLLRAMKQQIDPDNILNPEKLLP